VRGSSQLHERRKWELPIHDCKGVERQLGYIYKYITVADIVV